MPAFNFHVVTDSSDLSSVLGVFSPELDAPIGRNYVLPLVREWTDPASGGSLTRTNSVSGIPERFYEYKHATPFIPFCILVYARIGVGFDTSPNFYSWFVEWPYKPSQLAPRIKQATSTPGVCRLDVMDDGHYLFQLGRPGGGSVLMHFDVSSL